LYRWIDVINDWIYAVDGVRRNIDELDRLGFDRKPGTRGWIRRVSELKECLACVFD
jgi:hypothetical protein